MFFSLPQEVLEGILDLDLSVSEADDFIQFVSGGKIVSGSAPLAHRYGGHQVRAVLGLSWWSTG